MDERLEGQDEAAVQDTVWGLRAVFYGRDP
jgi:hypothetical protein